MGTEYYIHNIIKHYSKDTNLTITEEKKDGLDVYITNQKIEKILARDDLIICPNCYQDFSENEKNEINTKINKGKNMIITLFQEYRKKIQSYDVDIFDDLEKIYLEIENAKKDFINNQYYKHHCTNIYWKIINEKSFYIKLTNFVYSKIDFDSFSSFKPYKKYFYNNWKKDKILKALLLRERKRRNREKEILMIKWAKQTDIWGKKEFVNCIHFIEENNCLINASPGTFWFCLTLLEQVKLNCEITYISTFKKIVRYIKYNYCHDRNNQKMFLKLALERNKNFMSNQEYEELNFFIEQNIETKL